MALLSLSRSWYIFAVSVTALMRYYDSHVVLPAVYCACLDFIWPTTKQNYQLKDLRYLAG